MRLSQKLLFSAIFALLVSSFAVGQVVVDDSFLDGDRANTGSEPLESDWFTSSSSSGLEASPGILGHVTGTSGRGFHTIFPTQTLNVGDTISATYTFTTPDTVGRNRGNAFKVGLFDNLGRLGASPSADPSYDNWPSNGLADNVSASSGSPNAVYGWGSAVPATDALPGYFMDLDINTTTEDITFRETDPNATGTGRLMATNTGFRQVPNTGPDGVYVWAANTTYTETFSITRINDTDMQLTGTFDGQSHTVIDELAGDTGGFDSNMFGMLGFHVNSNTFGSTNSQGEADNGLDFSRICIELIPAGGSSACVVPEPGAMSLLAIAALAIPYLRRKR